jgi:hypothetical protein
MMGIEENGAEDDCVKANKKQKSQFIMANVEIAFT